MPTVFHPHAPSCVSQRVVLLIAVLIAVTLTDSTAFSNAVNAGLLFADAQSTQATTVSYFQFRTETYAAMKNMIPQHFTPCGCTVLPDNSLPSLDTAFQPANPVTIEMLRKTQMLLLGNMRARFEKCGCSRGTAVVDSAARELPVGSDASKITVDQYMAFRHRMMNQVIPVTVEECCYAPTSTKMFELLHGPFTKQEAEAAAKNAGGRLAQLTSRHDGAAVAQALLTSSSGSTASLLSTAAARRALDNGEYYRMGWLGLQPLSATAGRHALPQYSATDLSTTTEGQITDGTRVHAMSNGMQSSVVVMSTGRSVLQQSAGTWAWSSAPTQSITASIGVVNWDTDTAPAAGAKTCVGFVGNTSVDFSIFSQWHTVECAERMPAIVEFPKPATVPPGPPPGDSATVRLVIICAILALALILFVAAGMVLLRKYVPFLNPKVQQRRNLERRRQEAARRRVEAGDDGAAELGPLRPRTRADGTQRRGQSVRFAGDEDAAEGEGDEDRAAVVVGGQQYHGSSAHRRRPRQSEGPAMSARPKQKKDRVRRVSVQNPGEGAFGREAGVFGSARRQGTEVPEFSTVGAVDADEIAGDDFAETQSIASSRAQTTSYSQRVGGAASPRSNTSSRHLRTSGTTANIAAAAMSPTCSALPTAQDTDLLTAASHFDDDMHSNADACHNGDFSEREGGHCRQGSSVLNTTGRFSDSHGSFVRVRAAACGAFSASESRGGSRIGSRAASVAGYSPPESPSHAGARVRRGDCDRESVGLSEAALQRTGSFASVASIVGPMSVPPAPTSPPPLGDVGVLDGANNSAVAAEPSCIAVAGGGSRQEGQPQQAQRQRMTSGMTLDSPGPSLTSPMEGMTPAVRSPLGSPPPRAHGESGILSPVSDTEAPPMRRLSSTASLHIDPTGKFVLTSPAAAPAVAPVAPAVANSTAVNAAAQPPAATTAEGEAMMAAAGATAAAGPFGDATPMATDGGTSREATMDMLEVTPPAALRRTSTGSAE